VGSGKRIVMMKLGWSLIAVAIFAMPLSGCGGSGSSAEVGSTCFSADADAGTPATDCGTLTCLCAVGASYPGVCSETCRSKADCASLGDDVSCAKDKCTGTSVCLRGYKGEELP
jgi:hypothetical protein